MSEAILYKKLKKQAAQKAARFHMPGHKGRPILNQLNHPFSIDYTEIEGTGNLYAGDEPILSAEQAAARYYGAQDCLFLTGGSTQALITAIAAAVPAGGTLLIDRNCHKSAAHAMVLLDLKPIFVIPEPLDSCAPAQIHPQDIEAALQEHSEIAAVVVTSPNYYGILQDIPALADICHQHDVPLLVDAAHGAHCKAVGLPSPIEQGADLAAVSTHKTLPALGQSAVLLSSGRIAFETLLETAPMFGTSSPSYLLLASIDLARAWLEADGADAYARCAQQVAQLRRIIPEQTVFSVLTEEKYPLDPCRLTLCCDQTNVTGDELNAILHEQFGIDIEMSDPCHAVLICTGADAPRDYDRLMGALKSPQFQRIPSETISAKPFPTPERACSMRHAWFSKQESIPLTQAAGRICARPLTPYPPGVPLLYPGERITQVHIEFLYQKWYTEPVSICVMCEE